MEQILYTKLSTDISENIKRNDLILNKLKENENNYCLILSDRLNGLKYLQSMLNKGVLIDGSMVSKKAKKQRKWSSRKN